VPASTAWVSVGAARSFAESAAVIGVPSRAVVGQTISDATIILAAVDPCYCCSERVSAVERRTGKRLWSGAELVRLSQDATRRLRAKMGFPHEISKDP